jgi:hypothetical protein
MSPSTDRQIFRETVAAVAEKARARLPEAVNGRIESAVKLVLAGDVVPQEDGTVTVFSATDATRRYVLQGTGCTCADYERGQAPDGWCQHRIAAGIAKRVQELLPPDPAPVVPEVVEPWPDNDPEEPQDVPAGKVATATSAPPESAAAESACLPEAPVSITLKATFDGQEVLVTLRGHDFASVKAQVEEAAAWLKMHGSAPAAVPAQGQGQLSPQQHNAAAMHKRVVDFCKIHSVPMTLNTKDNRSWYSHRTVEGTFCKGR